MGTEREQFATILTLEKSCRPIFETLFSNFLYTIASLVIDQNAYRFHVFILFQNLLSDSVADARRDSKGQTFYSFSKPFRPQWGDRKVTFFCFEI